MITGNILNVEEMSYCDTVYNVSIGMNNDIDVIVYADNVQEALDITIDFYESKREEFEGFFFTDKELDDIDLSELTEYISGGNCGTYITFTYDEFTISECAVKDATLYIDLSNFSSHNDLCTEQ